MAMIDIRNVFSNFINIIHTSLIFWLISMFLAKKFRFKMISSFSCIFYLPAHIYATYKGLFSNEMVRRPQQHQIQKVSFLKAATITLASSPSKIYCIATFYLTELISRRKNELARLKHTKNSSECSRACNLYLITPF